jgi:hypothetical protein
MFRAATTLHNFGTPPVRQHSCSNTTFIPLGVLTVDMDKEFASACTTPTPGPHTTHTRTHTRTHARIGVVVSNNAQLVGTYTAARHIHDARMHARTHAHTHSHTHRQTPISVTHTTPPPPTLQHCLRRLHEHLEVRAPLGVSIQDLIKVTRCDDRDVFFSAFTPSTVPVAGGSSSSSSSVGLNGVSMAQSQDFKPLAGLTL